MSRIAWLMALLALGLGFALGWFGQWVENDRVPPENPGPSPDQTQRYREDLARARDEVDLLRAELAARSAGGAPAVAAPVTRTEEPDGPTVTDENVAAAKQALPDLEYRLSADPTNSTLLTDYIRTAALAGEHDRAIARIKALVEKYPDNADIITALGRAYLSKVNTVKTPIEQGQLAFGAIGEFSKALEKDETHFDARLYRAVLQYHMPPFLKKIDGSIRDFETMVEQGGGGAGDDRYAYVYRMLGRAYEKAGRKDDAEKAYEKGFALFPEDAGLKKAAGGGD